METGEIEFQRLGEARQVRDHEDVFVFVTPDEGEHFAVFGMEKFKRAVAESVPALA